MFWSIADIAFDLCNPNIIMNNHNTSNLISKTISQALPTKFGDSIPNKMVKYFRTLDYKKTLISNMLTIVLLAYVVFASLYINNFVSVNTLFAVLNRMGQALPMALGMACIMIVGCTDLSAGRNSGLVGIITASLLMQSGLTNQVFVGIGPVHWILPLILSLLIGAGISVINSLLIIRFRVHPFILTFAMSMVLNGVMFWYLGLGTNNNASITVNINTPYYDLINSGLVVNRQKLYYFVFAIGILLVGMWIFFNKTSLGLKMYAVGGNRKAANNTGVSIVVTTIVVFGIAGALFGLSGFIRAAQNGSTLNSGSGLDLDAIAACIIGGVSFAGGVGKIKGIVFGVFLMSFIQYSLTAMRVNTNYTTLVTGIIIVVAVSIDMWRIKTNKWIMPGSII